MASPSAQLLAEAAATKTCRDSLGRELTIKSLTALERLRLFKAIGPTLSQNAAYLGMATLASTVTAIDGVPLPFPLIEAHLEALVAKLGDAGISAAADVHALHQEQHLGSADQGN